MWDGPIAEELADLWWLLLAAGAAVYVLVLALLVRPLVRRRRASGRDGDRDGDVDAGATTEARPGVPTRMANRWIVAGGVVLPAVVLPAVLGASVAVMRDVPQSAPPGGLVVEVAAHQWWWSMRYPDQDVTVANELHIPVGEPVELRLTSTDVIHAFWVPDLAGKIDALPDGPNTLVIEADEPGEYTGSCAEFCGLQHAKMRLLVVAQPPARFAEWLAGQQRPAAEPAAGSAAARGERVFVRSGCPMCHTVRGTTRRGADRAPDLTHFASRRTLTAALMTDSTENLAAWITNPDMVKQGTRMRTPELAHDELDALLAYLESLR